LRYYIQLLENLKKGNIAPVHLFYGPEGYLREQAISEYKKKLVDNELADFNFDLLNGPEVTEEEVVAAASSPPVLGEKRLVVVRRAGFFAPSRAGAKATGKSGKGSSPLESYIAQPCQTTCLILETGETVDGRRKVFKEIVKLGGAVEFKKLTKTDLIKWINQMGKREGVDISRPAAELLVSRCGSDMYAIKNEMNKLIDYTGTAGRISEDDILFVVADRGEENIFAVVDALGNKNYAEALEGIRYLLLRKESPQAILGMLARQVRLILQASELSAAGFSFAEISKRMKVPNFVCKRALSQSKNFEQKELVNILRGMLQVDEYVKTGKQDFYAALEILFMDSCVK